MPTVPRCPAAQRQRQRLEARRLRAAELFAAGVHQAEVARQLGTPVEVFRRPANLFVAGFIGSTPMNLLEATVDDGALRAGPVGLPVPASARAHLAAGERVVVGVRPEYAALHPREVPEAIAGVVTLLESLGSAFLVSVESDGTRVQVTVPEGRQPGLGDRAWVVPDPERLLVYRKDDGELVGPALSGAGPRTPGRGAGR